MLLVANILLIKDGKPAYRESLRPGWPWIAGDLVVFVAYCLFHNEVTGGFILPEMGSDFK